jgi:hypothetical protein
MQLEVESNNVVRKRDVDAVLGLKDLQTFSHDLELDLCLH